MSLERLLDPWYASLIVTLTLMALLGAYALLDRFVKWLKS